jgi:hypothetical protein
MTGWAQVHGLSGDTSIPERVRFDNYYIEHWSLWMDLTILARTLTQPLAGAADSVMHRDNGKEAGTTQPATGAANSRIPVRYPVNGRQPEGHGHDHRAPGRPAG